MGFHIVNVAAPQCSLSCVNGQLRQETEDGERSLPLEDIAAIVVTSFSVTIHSKLLVECAKYGVALVLCEAFKPVSLVLPANRSTDTLLTRAMVELDAKTRLRLWQRCVDAKCENQSALARFIAPDDPATLKLADSAIRRSGHKESTCARFYWQFFGRHVGDAAFTREREAGGVNDLLNFGYAVLLSIVLQKLFAVGLDPTFGVSHATRERATPLGYDLMEPFRPCVDWRIIRWLNSEEGRSGPPAVTTGFRRWIGGVVTDTVTHEDHELSMQACIETTMRGFRRAVLAGDARFFKPWTQRSSKWAGL